MRAVALSLLLPSLAQAQDFTDPDDLSLGPLPVKKEEAPPPPAEGEPPPAIPVDGVPAEPAAAGAVEPAPAEPVAPPPRLWRNTVAVAATGGYEFSTAQPFAGLEFSAHHDGSRGFAPIGRAMASWGFADQRPLFRAEAGFIGVTRSPSGIVRVGLVGGTLVQITDLPTPLQVGEPEEGTVGQPAFLPYGQVVAEVGGLRPRAERGLLSWAAGLKVGAGAAVGNVPCEEAPEEGCVAVRAGFLGGIYGRFRFHEGVFLEVLAGPTSSISLGYVLTPKWKDRPE